VTAILAKLNASAAAVVVLVAEVVVVLDEDPELLPEELLDPPAEFWNVVELDPHADKAAAIPM
jgi:hypothetical protein